MKNLFQKTLVVSIMLVFAACEKNEDTTPEQPTETNQWTIETFDSQSDSYWGQFVKIAYDSKGGSHIAYVSNDNNDYELRYAYRDSLGAWSKETLVSLLFDKHIDIAVDPSDNVYIIYEDDQDECLHILEKPLNGQFNDVKLDILIDNTGVSRSYQARYGNLFADKNGNIHIAFERANNGVRYYPYSYQAVLDTSKLEDIDDNITGGNPDIIVNSNGDIHIISPGSYKLNYSSRYSASQIWSTKEEVAVTGDIQGFQALGLAVDELNNMHAVYLTTDDHLGYSPVQESNSWVSTTISNWSIGVKRGNLNIVTDTLDQARILYNRDDVLTIATKQIGWNQESIGNNETFRVKTSDLAIDSKNRSHIVFYDADTKEFKFATKVLE